MAAESLHSPTPEDIMEYLDGEGTPAGRAGIEAHLAACPACQAIAAEQRSQSGLLSAWQVARAPGSLRAPDGTGTDVPRRRWKPSRVVMAGLSAAAVVLLMVSYQIGQGPMKLWGPVPIADMSYVARDSVDTLDRSAKQLMGPSSTAAPMKAVPQGQNADTVAHGPAVIRTATLQLVAKDFNSARTAVDVIVDASAGFADQLGVSADPGSARVLRGTLRVPGAQLTGVLTRLRALGQVTQDQQHAQDVADQLVDLDARLKSARATEQRLIDLLKNRTGKLSDVLQVEQELTRVRLDIERLDAEKTNMSRRVAYATIDLTISEERKAGLDPGPLPLLTQLRIAAADGLQNVIDTVVTISLFVLRAGPSLVLWGAIVVTLWFAVRRGRRAQARPSA